MSKTDHRVHKNYDLGKRTYSQGFEEKRQDKHKNLAMNSYEENEDDSMFIEDVELDEEAQLYLRKK